MAERLVSLVTAAGMAVTVAACGSIGADARTFEPGIEAQPGPGQVRLVADPPQATARLTIELFDARDGSTGQRAATFGPGDPIEARMFGLPGPTGVLVDGTPCDGVFELRSDFTTTIVLTFANGRCAIVTRSTLPTN